MAIEQFDELGEVRQGAGQAVDLVDHNDIDLACPQSKAVASAFLIAPNYAAGKGVLAGLKANFKGSVSDEEYTKWPDQLDFSVELAKARAAKPDAVFAFYPGATSAARIAASRRAMRRRR